MNLEDWFLAQELLSRERTIFRPDVAGANEIREKVISKMRGVEDLLLTAAVDRLKDNKEIEDVVVGVGGKNIDVSFIYPKDIGGPRSAVPEAINFELASTAALGAVVLRDGVWAPEGGEPMPALMITMHVRGWGRTRIVPYEIKEDSSVVTHTPILQSFADESLVWLFSGS
jgi:hypothetical protein